MKVTLALLLLVFFGHSDPSYLSLLRGDNTPLESPSINVPESAPGPTDNSSELGKVIDKFNGIPVYYNGKISNVFGRNITHDGYNLGLKFQCVEYVKRYYYYRLDHKMSDSYGHARDFFDEELEDSAFNERRGLYQFSNGSDYKPEALDILVFEGDKYNPFGHVSLVTHASEDRIEVIQQNVGKQTREVYRIFKVRGQYYIDAPHILGWLRKG